jgi:hypothetical protein
MQAMTTLALCARHWHWKNYGGVEGTERRLAEMVAAEAD